MIRKEEKGECIMTLIQRLWKEESGQGLIEYGLLVALIVVIIGVVIGVFGDSLEALFAEITGELDSAIPGE